MLNIRKLPPALAKKAAATINEEPERTASAVEILRDWIIKQRHLRARTDDQFLTSFLRGCKFSVERAKQKIDYYYTVRTALPEWFKTRKCDSPKMLEAAQAGLYFYLPLKLEADLPALIFIRPGCVDPSKINVNKFLAFASLINDIQFLEDDNLAVSGCEFFIDCTGITMAHALQYDLVTLKKASVLYQDASPFRLKGFHFYNMPTLLEPVVNLFRSLLNEKLRNRFYFYKKSPESLQKISDHFPLELLPNEYGGNAGTIKDLTDLWAKKILSYEEFFEEEEKFGVNEKLRPGKPQTGETLFGVDGTFRKLNVD